MNKRKWIFIILSTLFALYAIFPFLVLILGSFLPNSYIINGLGVHELKNLTVDNYLEVYEKLFSAEKSDYWNYLKSTLLISVVTVIFVLILATFTAYFFSRLANRFLGKLSYLLIFNYLFPSIALIYAYYDFYSYLSLYNSIIGLIIANTAFCYPFSAWMLIGNFNEIPIIYDKTAILDGASKYSILRNIIIRKSFTGLFAISLFTFVLTWNELAYASNFTSSGSTNRPLSAGVVDTVLNQGESSQLGLFSAFGTFILIPLLCLMIFLEMKSHKLLLKENKSF